MTLKEVNSVLTISNKGWVVIPAEMRKKYNLVPGSKVIIVDYGGVLAILPAFKNPVEQGYGLLKGGASLTDALKKDRELEKKKKKKRGEVPEWMNFPPMSWTHLLLLHTFKANPPRKA